MQQLHLVAVLDGPALQQLEASLGALPANINAPQASLYVAFPQSTLAVSLKALAMVGRQVNAVLLPAESMQSQDSIAEVTATISKEAGQALPVFVSNHSLGTMTQPLLVNRHTVVDVSNPNAVLLLLLHLQARQLLLQQAHAAEGHCITASAEPSSTTHIANHTATASAIAAQAQATGFAGKQAATTQPCAMQAPATQLMTYQCTNPVTAGIINHLMSGSSEITTAEIEPAEHSTPSPAGNKVSSRHNAISLTGSAGKDAGQLAFMATPSSNTNPVADNTKIKPPHPFSAASHVMQDVNNSKEALNQGSSPRSHSLSGSSLLLTPKLPGLSVEVTKQVKEYMLQQACKTAERQQLEQMTKLPPFQPKRISANNISNLKAQPLSKTSIGSTTSLHSMQGDLGDKNSNQSRATQSKIATTDTAPNVQSHAVDATLLDSNQSIQEDSLMQAGVSESTSLQPGTTAATNASTNTNAGIVSELLAVVEALRKQVNNQQAQKEAQKQAVKHSNSVSPLARCELSPAKPRSLLVRSMPVMPSQQQQHHTSQLGSPSFGDSPNPTGVEAQAPSSLGSPTSSRSTSRGRERHPSLEELAMGRGRSASPRHRRGYSTPPSRLGLSLSPEALRPLGLHTGGGSMLSGNRSMVDASLHGQDLPRSTSFVSAGSAKYRPPRRHTGRMPTDLSARDSGSFTAAEGSLKAAGFREGSEYVMHQASVGGVRDKYGRRSRPLSRKSSPAAIASKPLDDCENDEFDGYSESDEDLTSIRNVPSYNKTVFQHQISSHAWHSPTPDSHPAAFWSVQQVMPSYQQAASSMPVKDKGIPQLSMCTPASLALDDSAVPLIGSPVGSCGSPDTCRNGQHNSIWQIAAVTRQQNTDVKPTDSQLTPLLQKERAATQKPTMASVLQTAAPKQQTAVARSAAQTKLASHSIQITMQDWLP